MPREWPTTNPTEAVKLEAAKLVRQALISLSFQGLMTDIFLGWELEQPRAAHGGEAEFRRLVEAEIHVILFQIRAGLGV